MAKKDDTPKPAPERVRPELDVIEQSYVSALDTLRTLFASMKAAEKRLLALDNPVPEAIAVYARIYTIREKFEDVGKAMTAMKDIFAKKTLPDAMEAQEVETLTISEGHRATVTSKVFASIQAEQREAAYQWLRDNGAEDLIVPTVNASTLSAFAKTRMEEQNESLPDDLFKVTTIPSVSLTRAKGWSIEPRSNMGVAWEPQS